jgi:hypothetical protein
VAAEQTIRQKPEKEKVLRLLLGLDVLDDKKLCKVSFILYKYTTYSSKSKGRHCLVELNSKLVLGFRKECRKVLIASWDGFLFDKRLFPAIP